MRIGIVGAGIAGLACAKALADNGHDVILCDKGRRPGGRTASRRITTDHGDACFDIGAQYFTVHDDGFQQQVDAWRTQGLIAPWPSAGEDAYVGVPAMRSIAHQMARGLKINQAARVTTLEPRGAGWRLSCADGTAVEVDLALIATPAEQAAALLASVAPDLAQRARGVPSEPCWTGLFTFEKSLKTTQDCWRDEGIIGWAARNNSKPGRGSLESWVVQATSNWSRGHIEADPPRVATTLKCALAILLDFDISLVESASVHLWRFARSGVEGSGAVFDRERRLGICGDWLIAPRIEAAWRSGMLLAQRIGLDGDHDLDRRRCDVC